MALATLYLYKGMNNGLEGATLYEEDASGNVAAFDLTGASSITVQILDSSNTVVTSFTGTAVAPATNGIFNARPGASDLTVLVSNQAYYYQVKVVNSTYAQGRIFALDSDGRRLRCIVI